MCINQEIQLVLRMPNILAGLSAVSVRLPLLVLTIWQFCRGAYSPACVAQDLYIGAGALSKNSKFALALIDSSQGCLVLYKYFLRDHEGTQSVTPFHVTHLNTSKKYQSSKKAQRIFVKCFQFFFISFVFFLI